MALTETLLRAKGVIKFVNPMFCLHNFLLAGDIL